MEGNNSPTENRCVIDIQKIQNQLFCAYGPNINIINLKYSAINMDSCHRMLYFIKRKICSTYLKKPILINMIKYMVRLPNDAELFQCIEAHTKDIHSMIQMTWLGKPVLVTASKDGFIKVWNMETFEAIKAFSKARTGLSKNF